MKILFLYASGGKIITGGQKYEDDLMRLLQKQEGVTVDRIWLNNVHGKIWKHTLFLRNLRLIGKARRYDLVFFNSVHGASFMLLSPVLRRFFGTKTAVIHHHFLAEEMEGWKRGYYRMLETGFLRGASSIIVPSPYINDRCRIEFPGKDIRYWQIPFKAVPAGESAPVPGNLLYIGTVERRKGLVYLLEAMAALKQRGVACRLKIIGKTVEEEYRHRLDGIVSARGLDVEFTGFISEEHKNRLIQEADIFTFPSLLEGYGMAICESMVNGLPVVCFDNSAMPYTVKDGFNGMLVPDRDVDRLADAIGGIITDRALRGRLSRGALQTVSTFMTPERYQEQVTADINDMMRRR